MQPPRRDQPQHEDSAVATPTEEPRGRAVGPMVPAHAPPKGWLPAYGPEKESALFLPFPGKHKPIMHFCLYTERQRMAWLAAGRPPNKRKRRTQEMTAQDAAVPVRLPRGVFLPLCALGGLWAALPAGQGEPPPISKKTP